jgi:hypothetical protein
MLVQKPNIVYLILFSVFQGNYEENALFVQKVHFRGFQRKSDN